MYVVIAQEQEVTRLGMYPRGGGGRTQSLEGGLCPRNEGGGGVPKAWKGGLYPKMRGQVFPKLGRGLVPGEVYPRLGRGVVPQE